MTWVRIDKDSVESAMTRTIEVSRRAIVVLDGYQGLGETTGLGDLGPGTAELVASSWRALTDAWETYLRESIALVEKVLELVRDQRAASVVGVVNEGGLSPSEAIVGGTIVGGFGGGWTLTGDATSLIGGAAIVGGTVVGAATAMSAGSAIVGGTLVGAATPMGSGASTVGGFLLGDATRVGGGSAIVGGTPTYANDPLMRAAIAAQERGDTRLASQMLGVSGTINDSINHSISLTLAPNGARSMGSYGPSPGYEPYGSYGIEVPIYSR